MSSLKNGNSEKKRRRRAVIRRDGEICQGCGATENLTLDHIIPKSRGGADAIRNLQLLCQPCNNKKADRLPDGVVVNGGRVQGGRRAKRQLAMFDRRAVQHLPECDGVFCMFGCPVFHGVAS